MNKKLFFSSRFLLAGLFITGTLNSSYAQYATSGAGRYKNQAYWLDWASSTGATGLTTAPAGYNNQVVNGAYTWTIVPDKIRVLGTVSNLSLSNINNMWVGNTTGSWSHGFANMFTFDSPSPYIAIGAYVNNNGAAGAMNFDLQLQTQIYVNGAWVNVTAPGLFVADAESTGSNESLSATIPDYEASSVGWEVLDYNSGNLAAGTTSTYQIDIASDSAYNNGVSSRVTLHSTHDVTESALLFARGTASLKNISLASHGNGAQDIAVGILLPFDYGDAPESYGDASHYLNAFDNNGTVNIIANGTADLTIAGSSYLNATANYNANGGTTLWLGNVKPDADPTSFYTDSANGDDIHDSHGDEESNVVNDEDGVAIPADLNILNIGTQQLTITANNTGTGAANIYGWIDKDQNGTFDVADQLPLSSATVAAGTENMALNVDFPLLKAGYYYARFRISTDDLHNSPTAAGVDGETEDYRIHVKGYTINGNVYWDGNGITDSAVNGNGAQGGHLYLVDHTGKVIQKSLSDGSDGAYTFEDVDTGVYKVYVSDNADISIGTTPASSDFYLAGTTPLNVGQKNSDGTLSANGYGTILNGYADVVITDTTDISVPVTIAQGIDLKPVAADGSYEYNSQPEADAVLSLSGLLQGSDSEDQPAQAALDGKKVTIASLPSNGTLLYNGTPVTTAELNTTIYDPAGLSFQFTGTGYNTSSFDFSYIDNAGIASDPATYSISIPIPLPVKYAKELTVNGHNGQVCLNWATGTEVNNAFFSIERSQDGKNDWAAIGRVASFFASGNGAGHSYTFTDKAPFSGTSYYRLRQVDIDNNCSYSNIAVWMAGNSTGNDVRIYPNPADGMVHIALAQVSGNAAYELRNEVGSMVKKGSLNHTDGNGIDVHDLPSGVYMLQITDGDNSYAHKVLIVR